MDEDVTVVIGTGLGATFSQLLIWTDPHLPVVGDEILLTNIVPMSLRGWYKVEKRVWKPTEYQPKLEEGIGTSWRIYGGAWLQIVVKKFAEN